MLIIWEIFSNCSQVVIACLKPLWICCNIKTGDDLSFVEDWCSEIQWFPQVNETFGRSTARNSRMLFSLVAGLHFTKIQQIQKIRFFLIGYCVAHFFFFDWLISGTSRQNSRGFGETCLIAPWWGQRGQVMFVRCGTLNSLEVFFQREKYDVWRECVTKDRNEWLSRSMRDTWEPS